jgi:hypothetical protein
MHARMQSYVLVDKRAFVCRYTPYIQYVSTNTQLFLCVSHTDNCANFAEPPISWTSHVMWCHLGCRTLLWSVIKPTMPACLNFCEWLRCSQPSNSYIQTRHEWTCTWVCSWDAIFQCWLHPRVIGPTSTTPHLLRVCVRRYLYENFISYLSAETFQGLTSLIVL